MTIPTPVPSPQGAPMPCPHRTAGDDGERQAGKEADRQADRKEARENRRRPTPPAHTPRHHIHHKYIYTRHTHDDPTHEEETHMDTLHKLTALNAIMGVNAETFCKLTGLQPSNYTQMKAGRRSCGNGIANRICAALGLSRVWFDAWDGNPDTVPPRLANIDPRSLAGRHDDTTTRPAIPTPREWERTGIVEVPFVPVKAHCGYLTSYGDDAYIDTLPTIPVAVERRWRGPWRIFEASGDSMDNDTRESLCDGDRILARGVARDLWLPRLSGTRDWYYVIVHRTEGIAIKQITAQDDHGNLTCHSLNPMFSDYTVNLADVAELYQVVKIIERSMRL